MAEAPMYARGEFSTVSGSLAKAVGDYEGYLGQYAKIDGPGFQARMFDSNHDGKISEVELINGYSFAANSFAHKPGIQTVSTSGFMFWSQQHNLIIADTHQKYLVNRLGTKTYLTLVDNG